ncbi:MAG: copper resistance protein NlpE N-terminal domain-containing protein [Gelidibacter sp.]
MNLRLTYTCLLTLALVFSCNDHNKKDSGTMPENEIMGDNNMTSLDWAGTYEGVLPCADCDGIKSVITINKDNTYVARETYQGKSDSIYETKGTFKWDGKGQKIFFSGKEKSYFVGENTLTHLDKDGNKITGDLAERYILTKSEEQLVGKIWHLVSFKGEAIQLKEAKAEHPQVEFLEDGSISGYTGCNQFRGVYELKEGYEIKFSQIISTKKFCPEMETENEFLSTMSKASYYIYEGHDLVIHDSEHQKLAKFKIAN